MKILVTGGAGYIGSHACKALAKAGYTPVTYDNLSRGHRWAVKWGPLEEGDIADEARLREVIRTHQPDAVMHFAAYAYAGESVQEPALYYGNNVSGSWRLLESLRAEGVSKIVFSSSCSVHGDAAVQPITESAPYQPVSPYGFSKFAIERMLSDYGRAYDLKSVSLRYFNASGADPDGGIGEVHEPETHLIPLVLEVAAGKRKHLQIHGSDYPTPDGTCVRDYIHVSDLARAHVMALDRMLGHGLTGAYNLGTGVGYSVQQVVDAARQVTGHKIPVEMGPRREGDPARAVADPSLAKQKLGWEAEFKELPAIIGSAWRWMQKGQR